MPSGATTFTTACTRCSPASTAATTRTSARIEQLAKAFKEGFVYSWQFSRIRQKFHGSSSRHRPARQFVVFAQNHDQIGNRMLGERLSRLVDFESLKLAAGTLLLSPYIPLLFMGEEYAEEAPFLYFVSHTDPELVAAVREGRKAEFEAFQGQQQCPDPQEAESFQDSKLQWDQRDRDRHRVMLAFYRHLLELRWSIPHVVSKRNLMVEALPRQKVMIWHRRHEWGQVSGLLNFDAAAPGGALASLAENLGENPGLRGPEMGRPRRGAAGDGGGPAAGDHAAQEHRRVPGGVRP